MREYDQARSSDSPRMSGDFPTRGPRPAADRLRWAALAISGATVLVFLIAWTWHQTGPQCNESYGHSHARGYLLAASWAMSVVMGGTTLAAASRNRKHRVWLATFGLLFVLAVAIFVAAGLGWALETSPGVQC